jgi:lysophospholipase L1-like esterase
MKKKILIFGDSWGKGEWCSETNKLIHKGIEQYFDDDGFIVKNYSLPGGSFNNILGIIDDNKIFLENYDIVFFIQTDPFRNFIPYQENDFTKFKSYSSLLLEQNNIIDSTYKKLNGYNKKIYCIGGCTKLNLNLIKKYENLEPLIESIIEFLIPDLKQPTFWMSDWNYLFAKNLNVDELELFLNDCVNPNTLFKHKEFFWPDGSHPNRTGHKLIYKKICDFLKI